MFTYAYRGKSYRTRDGHEAIYIKKIGSEHWLVVDEDNNIKINVQDNGHIYTDDEIYDPKMWDVECPQEMMVNHPMDIIGEWHECINEEELDRLATIEAGKAMNHFVNREQSKFALEWADLVKDAFKAGYYKAKEE